MISTLRSFSNTWKLGPVFLGLVTNLTALLSSSVSYSSTVQTENPGIEPSPTVTAPPGSPLTQDCNDTLNDESTPEGVKTALRGLDTELTRDNCIIIRQGQFSDNTEIINSLPENTVILLSSDQVSEQPVMEMTSSMALEGEPEPTFTTSSMGQQNFTTTPSASTSVTNNVQMATPAQSVTSTSAPFIQPTPSLIPPSPGVINREFSLSKPIKLKNGQHILSAAEDGFRVVLKEANDFEGGHMIEIGTSAENFMDVVDEIDSSVVRGITFEPVRGDGRRSVDSIFYAQCYNRDLLVLDNHFTLDARASVYLRCSYSFENDIVGSGLELYSRPMGPGLDFSGNTVRGDQYQTARRTFTPDEALLIYLPNIQGLQDDLLVVRNNTFEGHMIEAIEAHIGLNSKLRITGNTIHINTSGKPFGSRGHDADFHKGGILLRGLNGGQNRDELPLYLLADNDITTQDSGAKDRVITLLDQLQLGFSCNRLEGTRPWKQKNNPPAVYTAFYDLSPYCDSVADTLTSMATMTTSMPSVSPTPAPSPVAVPAINIMNTWSASGSAMFGACEGLVHLVGEIQFETAMCESTQPPTPAPVAPSTPSAKTTTKPTDTVSTQAVATTEGMIIENTPTKGAATTNVMSYLTVLAMLGFVLVY